MQHSKIYLATGNKQKLERLKKLFSQINGNILIESYPNLIDVEETGITSMENALQKIAPYKNSFLEYPILATDTALFFDGINFDPTKVKGKALAEKGLKESNITQEEKYNIMLEFYKNLATEKGGELEFYFLDSWVCLLPNLEIKTIEYKREYILTNKEVGEKQLFFPLCNLYKSKTTGKYRTEWNENDYFIEFKKQIDAMKYLFNL